VKRLFSAVLLCIAMLLSGPAIAASVPAPTPNPPHPITTGIPSTAGSVRLDDSGNMIVTGEIYDSELDDAAKLLQTGKVKRIVLVNSPGGNFDVGVALGMYVHTNGIDTEARGECMSACAYIWLAGTHRYYTSDAQIGIHTPGVVETDGSLADPSDPMSVTGYEEAAWYLGAIGIPGQLVMKIEQIHMPQIGLLSPDVMQSYGLSTELVSD
jgi:hypothetical protein